MLNLYNNTNFCGHSGGCSSYATFCALGDDSVLRCPAHKEPGMVPLYKDRICDHPGGCKKRPSFGLPDSLAASRCADHKCPGMINVFSKTCEHPGGCSKHPSFGIPGEPLTRCAAHKAPGMLTSRQWKALVCEAAQQVAAGAGQLAQPPGSPSAAEQPLYQQPTPPSSAKRRRAAQLALQEGDEDGLADRQGGSG